MTGEAASGAQTAPAVARNRDPILDVLRRVLPAQGTVLEIASGTGEHAVHFARGLPGIAWQPTDRDEIALRSIAAWREAERLPNLNPPLAFDVTGAWPVERVDAIVCINMIHISPWRSAQALMAGVQKVLPRGGVLFLYGPFKENGVHTAPSNESFDASLRSRDPEWGVRDLADVKTLAAASELDFIERVAMPANNLSVVFRRR